MGGRRDPTTAAASACFLTLTKKNGERPQQEKGKKISENNNKVNYWACSNAAAYSIHCTEAMSDAETAVKESNVLES